MCDIYIPCILTEARFGYQCVDQATCDHVETPVNKPWQCVGDCQGGKVLAGNLCIELKIVDEYLVV